MLYPVSTNTHATAEELLDVSFHMHSKIKKVTILVISKERGWLVIPNTYCLNNGFVGGSKHFFFHFLLHMVYSITHASEYVVGCSAVSVISVLPWNRLVKANIFIRDLFLPYFLCRRRKTVNKVQHFVL
jgi:hypothetical protein